MERDLGRLGICLALLRGTDWADTSLHWDDTMEAESVRSDNIELVLQCYSLYCLTFVVAVRVDIAVRLSWTWSQSAALAQITDVDDGLHAARPCLAEVTDIVDIIAGVGDHPEVHLPRIYRS